MKDQIIMGRNGEVAIAIPLYRLHEQANLDKLDGYAITLTNEKPIAYAIDMGTEENCQLVNAAIIESQCEFLGDL